MDWGYVAGYFDGEGSVDMSRTHGLHFVNTNHRSLEAIQAFVGCGGIYTKGQAAGPRKQSWKLTISRRADVIRVIDAMLPHSIIKREQLLALRALKESGRDAHPMWGTTSTLDPETVRHRYHAEGLTCSQIGETLGVSGAAIHQFMAKHQIERRPRGKRAPR